MKTPKRLNFKSSKQASPKASKQAKGEAVEKPLTVIRAPWLLAYRYLGIKIQKYLPYFTDLGLTMQRAAIKISLQSYVCMLVLLSGASTIISFAMVVSLVMVAGAALWLAL